MSAIALTGSRVWDGVANRVSPSAQTIRIEGERIAAIGDAPELLEGARRIDLDGTFAIPGLIDAHVHLTLDPEIRVTEEQTEVAPEEIESGMTARVLAMLQAGITTARDLGGGEFRELALRDRIAAGELPGPRILCAGQPLTSPNGHCHFWGGEAATPDEIRRVIRRQVEHGVDLIKVMATGGVITRGSDPTRPQFDTRQLELVVAEAAEHGHWVAAHCPGTPGIYNAARARVRTVGRGSRVGTVGFGGDVDPEVVGELARAGLWVSPTVNSGWKRFFKDDGAPGRFATRMSHAFDSLRSAGVPLIASTDAGIPGVVHHRLPEALAVFSRVSGMSAVETLRSATSESARALGLSTVTGRLTAGLSADLVVLDADPLLDLGALSSPRLVCARGNVHEREPTSR